MPLQATLGTLGLRRVMRHASCVMPLKCPAALDAPVGEKVTERKRGMRVEEEERRSKNATIRSI